MTLSTTSLLAEVGRPLFDNQWLALFVIMGSITAFLLAIATVGKWLAATHPAEPKSTATEPAPVLPTALIATPAPVKVSAPAATQASSETPAEIFAIIAAAVAVTLGAKARIAAINPVPAEGTIEHLRQWSLEGRRQIYSSHNLR